MLVILKDTTLILYGVSVCRADHLI